MRNPLNKRIPKELKSEIGKYIVIFVFMTATIGLLSGFLVAASSMIKAYDESFEKYTVEWGHFTLGNEASEDLIESIEDENVTLYKDYYKNLSVDIHSDGTEDATLRLYENRDEINQICLMSGDLPKKDDELAIDRMFAENNSIEIGDTITVDGIKYEICGLTAFPDYSCLFENNNDTMFDAILFGVGISTENAFASHDDNNMVYCYAWLYDEAPEDELAEKEMSDTFCENIVEKIYMGGNSIDIYTPRYLNRAIQFTGDDLGSDSVFILTLLYIVVVIMAFVFAVTTINTITKESQVIGTLRASGYTRGELLRHYMTLPTLVGLLACIVGNILGYTCLKSVGESAYYGSYSLTTYVTRFDLSAFINTTVIPFVLLVIVNAIIISSKLRISPLRFIRRDLSRSKRKKAVKLPHFKFMNRFRIRIIFQNMSSYLTLFVGICFADVLLLFGMMMSPLLSHYQDEIVNNLIADYRYILRTPAQTSNTLTEKYAVTGVAMDDEDAEEVTVYGIAEDSAYFKTSLKSGDVLISNGYSEKYGIKTGDTICLREIYDEDTTYNFKVTGTYDYPSTMAVFMSIDDFREEFDKDSDYFTGYFSNEELTDLEDSAVASVIDENAMTKASRQLERSMGSMFQLFNVFAIILFALLVYLLTKLIIEKNVSSISLTKILGYTNKEINGLYMTANIWVVLISSFIGILFSAIAIQGIFSAMMAEYVSGYMACYIKPSIYPIMIVISLVVFFTVQLTQIKKIKNIPMDEALKNTD